MRLILAAFLLFSTQALSGQTLEEKTPALGQLVDKSLEGEIEFIKLYEECERLWFDHRPFECDDPELTGSEQQRCRECEIAALYEGYWEVVGNGCSWYCGGGLDTITATSHLMPHNKISYSPRNIHDLSYKTAWIEGVPGYGIGESVTFHFPPQSPRITEIIVVNGYVKSLRTWKQNSRVKKLKMHLNEKPFAILHLADSRQKQHFRFPPIGYNDREDYDKLSEAPWWTIRFEIMEVYEGDKYDDTAITEIYFDGIDVH